MIYCNIGDNPKIFITFGDGQKIIFEPKFAPVEVIIENFVSHTSNHTDTGYQISGYSTNNYRGFSLIVRDYEIRDSGSDRGLDGRYQLWARLCDSNTLVRQFYVDPASIIIDSNITCGGSQTDKQKVRVHIKRPNAAAVFTAEGDSPCKIEVVCGDCPEGYFKCKISKYPGYCCVPCKEVGDRLKNIANKVGR